MRRPEILELFETHVYGKQPRERAQLRFEIVSSDAAALGGAAKSAEDDRWADPRGEFLAAKHVSTVYHLLDEEGLAATEMPGVEEPVSGTIGYQPAPRTARRHQLRLAAVSRFRRPPPAIGVKFRTAAARPES